MRKSLPVVKFVKMYYPEMVGKLGKELFPAGRKLKNIFINCSSQHTFN